MILHFIVEVEVPDEEAERLSQALWEVMPESEKRAFQEQKLPEVRISPEVAEMLNRDHQRVTCEFLKEFVENHSLIYSEYGEGYFFDREE